MIDTELTTTDGMRTITVFYSGPVTDWDALFREAAARYGLAVDEHVRFLAVPIEGDRGKSGCGKA